MKSPKINVLIGLLLLITFISYSQINPDNRNLQTRIADILSQLPATNSVYFDKLMNEMSSIGEEGLIEIAGMLTAPGKGNDAPVRYAISGFTNYVSSPGREKIKSICLNAWCKSMDKATDKEITSFLISQVQLIGNNDAVTYLEKYLADEKLCDAASRALTSINTPSSTKALLNNLQKTTGANQISLVKALGDIRSSEAIDMISKLVKINNVSLKKVALYALANTGSPKSQSILFKEAEKVGFTYDPLNATGSYLLWIKRLSENRNSKLAVKNCKKLIKLCESNNQEHTRCEALRLLANNIGEKSLPFLIKASESGSYQYFKTALGISSELKGEKVVISWIKRAPNTISLYTADILTMLGETGDPAALPLILSSYYDISKNVRLAAIQASARLGKEKVVPDLLSMLKMSEKDEINAIKSALLIMPGKTVLLQIAEALPNLRSYGKIAMIEVLASRRASDYLSKVLAETISQDTNVKMASYNALPYLVSEKDLPELYDLLLRVRIAEEIQAVQAAIVAAVKTIKGQDKQLETILVKFDNVNDRAKTLFFPVFGGIGSNKALDIIVDAFNTGETVFKQPAFDVLINWPDTKALNELFNICYGIRNIEYSDQAFKAYLRIVSNSNCPPEQKLLFIRKAMVAARKVDHIKLILKETDKLDIFQALVFAGTYLDIPGIQKEAANSVIKIALSNKALHGDIIKDMLIKAFNRIEGQEKDSINEAVQKHIAAMPSLPGYVSLFNGKDLSGWKASVGNPLTLEKIDPAKQLKEQEKADEMMKKAWSAKDGMLVFNGKGGNIGSVKQYGDFEMIIDWKINKAGVGGICLRGVPQVQIWDTARHDIKAEVGSGGLINNVINENKPLKVADNPAGDWNTFYIKMIGERVTVYLNGELVVNNVILENFWDRNLPVFLNGAIELLGNGSWIGFRDIFIRELPGSGPYRVSEQEKSEGFRELFDGITLQNWSGNTKDYVVEDGNIVIYPEFGGQGNLYTKEEFSDFDFRFDFQLTPGANNGIGIRAPTEGDAAYMGMEIQVLDSEADIYKNLDAYQYHGSVYGVIPAKRGFLKPAGEWNQEQIIAKGNRIRVILNGTVILDGDISEAGKNGTIDGKPHPGLLNVKGHIGFLGHGSTVRFRNIRIKDLTK